MIASWRRSAGPWVDRADADRPSIAGLLQIASERAASEGACWSAWRRPPGARGSRGKAAARRLTEQRVPLVEQDAMDRLGLRRLGERLDRRYDDRLNRAGVEVK